MTSCPDDEALDRRYGSVAVHVAMRQHRQYLFAEANATTAAGSDRTNTTARSTGTTDEAVAGAAASTATEAGADAVAKETVTGTASGGLPTAADEADAGTRRPHVSLGSGTVVEHDGAVSVSGTPQQVVFQQ